MKANLNKAYSKMKQAAEIGVTLREDWKRLEITMSGQKNAADFLIYFQQQMRMSFLLYDTLRELCAFVEEFVEEHDQLSPTLEEERDDH